LRAYLRLAWLGHFEKAEGGRVGRGLHLKRVEAVKHRRVILRETVLRVRVMVLDLLLIQPGSLTVLTLSKGGFHGS